MSTIMIIVVISLCLSSAEYVRRASRGESLGLQVCLRGLKAVSYQPSRLEEGSLLHHPRLKETHQALGYKPCRILLLYGSSTWKKGSLKYMMRCTYLSL